MLPYARQFLRQAITAAALVTLVAARGTAQNEDSVTVSPTAYRVSALVGLQMFDESAALDKAPFIGMRISRPLTGIFAAGLNLAFSRPNTRGEYFPWNRQIYFSDASHLNDTTLLFQVEQRVTFATTTLDLGVGFGGDRDADRFSLSGIRLGLNAGAGFWAVWLDPERTKGNNGHGGMAFPLGAELQVPVGRSASIGARVDDVILTNFYRDMFNLSDPLLSEDLFLNPLVPPPPGKTTIHNMRLTLAFSFVPGVREK
jgi:hypothetical protein